MGCHRVLEFSLAVVLCLVSAGVAAQGSESVDGRPNILVILVDDLGYGDLGVYDHPTIRTPNIDRLAAEGIRFTDFYSAAPVCSPARAAFLTGRIPVRTGIYDWIPPGSDMHLSAEEATVAEILRAAGYQTSMFGKWHLNGALDTDQPQPDDHGFNHWFATAGFAMPTHLNPVNFVSDGEEVGPTEGYACQIVTDEAIRWLREDREPTQPFFAYLAYHEPHEVIASPPELTAGYEAAQNGNEALYFANVTNLDLALGRLLAALDEMGLTDDTFVLFTSDNGPEMLERHPQAQRSYGSAGPLRGKKLQLWEGGIRVPGIVRWPGHTQPGSVSGAAVSGIDLLPTVCAVAGVPVPVELELDGIDITPIFAGEVLDREVPLFWYHYKAWGGPRAVMREGRWKLAGFWDGPERLRSDSSTMRPGDLELIRTTELIRFELFDIEADPGERADVAGKNPAVFKAMHAEMVRLLAEVESDARHDWQESWLRRW